MESNQTQTGNKAKTLYGLKVSPEAAFWLGFGVTLAFVGIYQYFEIMSFARRK